MRKVRLTDIKGCSYAVNTEAILYLREDCLKDMDGKTMSVSTAIMMPDGLRISFAGTLEETIVKLGWHV